MNDTTPSEQGDADTGTRAGAATGLFRSLKSLAATMVALAHTRLELLTTELQEEVQRAAGAVIWSFLALLSAIVALFFAGLTIVLVYWDTHRILAAVLVTSTFFAFTVASVAMLLLKINSRPRFLDATLAELGRDAAALQDKL
jgi:uncharacterized membrane protein YqjE